MDEVHADDERLGQGAGVPLWLRDYRLADECAARWQKATASKRDDRAAQQGLPVVVGSPESGSKISISCSEAIMFFVRRGRPSIVQVCLFCLRVLCCWNTRAERPTRVFQQQRTQQQYRNLPHLSCLLSILEFIHVSPLIAITRNDDGDGIDSHDETHQAHIS